MTDFMLGGFDLSQLKKIPAIYPSKCNTDHDGAGQAQWLFPEDLPHLQHPADWSRAEPWP